MDMCTVRPVRQATLPRQRCKAERFCDRSNPALKHNHCPHTYSLELMVLPVPSLCRAALMLLERRWYQEAGASPQIVETLGARNRAMTRPSKVSKPSKAIGSVVARINKPRLDRHT